MRANWRDEHGQVLPLTALFMVVLLLAAALTIDYASWLSTRRDYQGVVDAAALAAAGQLPPPGIPVNPPTTFLDHREYAAAEALQYLNDHFGWGQQPGWALTTAATLVVGQTVGTTAPLVVTAGGSTYCVWVWTPTPVGSELTTSSAGSTNCLPTPGDKVYSPANFPNDAHKVFVRVQSARPAFFAGIAGISNEVVPALAVAGGAASNWAIITLKPQQGSPDNVYGINITGTNTVVQVPIGNIGGNYTLQFGGGTAEVLFPDSTLDQTVSLMRPDLVSKSTGQIVGGKLAQLDGLIDDPRYFDTLPSYCQGPVTGPCLELHSMASGGAQGPWSPPPSVSGANGLAVYPSNCPQSNPSQQILDLSCLSKGDSWTVFPGQYQQVKIPPGINATLSPTCYKGDPALGIGSDLDCINNDRAGVFYFSSSKSQDGLLMNGTPQSGTSTLFGCGVLTIFDPNENGGHNVQFNVSGSGNEVDINHTSADGTKVCNLQYAPGNPTGTQQYKWYGHNDTSGLTNPVSMWVRPNAGPAAGYDMIKQGGGSKVISFGAGNLLQENGVIYGPEDNTTVAGGGASGAAIGQVVAWTITYTGNSSINETFQGPATLNTRLFQ